MSTTLSIGGCFTEQNQWNVDCVGIYYTPVEIYLKDNSTIEK